MTSSFMTIFFGSVTVIIALAGISLIFAKLYQRASKEISFVRTGFGGQKVIVNGGALVFPVLHEIIQVNMNTLRLSVDRANEQALITRDRMRVDIVAEFYLRVQPTAEAIANAAQTLGQRTMNPEELRELVEGKFVDALRSVAAEMSMEELHEKRTDFVQKVQQVVTEDLLKNGLELETVSLTGLNQTAKDYFNPNNVFDAEGLMRLTNEIERRRKIRNDIEQETAIQIRNKNLESEKQRLAIEREEQYAVLEQQREIEIRRAEQNAEILKQTAEKHREAEQAQIVSKQQVEQSRLSAEQLISEKKIQVEQTVETQTITKEKILTIAEQEREIAIAEMSKSQSEAKAQADMARAKAAQAEEQVITSREKEIAERQKQIELIEAAKNAERAAIAVKIAAEAEKIAAIDKASALREEAKAQADKIRITAEGEAEAEKIKSAAAEIRYHVEAAGKRAIHEADNILSNDQINMKVKLEIIENLDRIIRESVKPLERIDSIKIFQVDGLNNTAGNTEASATNASNISDQVVNSALRYRTQAPILDSLLKEIGISGNNINSFANILKEEEA